MYDQSIRFLNFPFQLHAIEQTVLLAAIYKFHFEVAALLKEVRRDRFMPAKLTEFARSRLIATEPIYKFVG
jgi:hypothetical protein